MPKLKVLLDTNVIISALYVGGKPLRILELAESGDIEIFLSPFILNEIQQVLMDKLGWESNKVRSVIKKIETSNNPKSGRIPGKLSFI